MYLTKKGALFWLFFVLSISFVTAISGDGELVRFSVSNSVEDNLTVITPSYSSASEEMGYIVKIGNSAPLAVEAKRLSDAAISNQKRIESYSGYNPLKYVAPIYSVLPDEVPGKVQDYENKLKASRESVKNKIARQIPDLNSRAVKEYSNVFNGLALKVSPSEAEKLKDISGIEIYPDLEVNISLMDSVPLIQEGIAAGKLDEDGNDCTVSGKTCLDGSGVKIAVIDTGVDYTHPDLGGCFGTGCKVSGGWDFVNNDADPMDDMGHGTHCAATAAGNGVLKGVAPGAEIYSYKVLDQYGRGSFSNVIAGIERAVDPNQDGDFSDHVDVISMSLGANCRTYDSSCGPDDPSSQAIDNAVDAGVVSVIAAGNSGPGEGTIGSPGTARKAITVGASSKTDVIASFSSRGPVMWEDGEGNKKGIIKPDIVAPGVSICAAQALNKPWNDRLCFDDKHVAISGTSMATPHVAGAAAILQQKNPTWTPGEIKFALRNSAKGIQESAISQGMGRINILDASQRDNSLGAKLKVYNLLVGRDTNRKIDIYGSAYGENFANYTLYYASEDDPSNWIKLMSGDFPVLDGILYPDFDTDYLSDGLNYFKLVVLSRDGFESRDIDFVRVICSDCAQGWPKLTLPMLSKSPLCADVDRDGNKEIIDFSGKKLYIFRVDGTKILEKDFVLINGVAVGDLDSDGENEIVISELSQVFVLSSSGETKSGWPKLINGKPGLPVLTDLDNDGDLEILIGETAMYTSDRPPTSCTTSSDCKNLWECWESECVYLHNQIYAWNYDGSEVSGWPIKKVGNTRESPAVGDINNDGNIEVVTASGDLVYPDEWVYVYVFKSDGTPLEGWPKRMFNTSAGGSSRVLSGMSGPVLADVNGDGNKEIFIHTGLSRVSESNPVVYAFYSNGSNLSGWPYRVSPRFGWSSMPRSGLSISDINGDGSMEVIFSDSDSRVHVVKNDGTPLVVWPYEGDRNSLSSLFYHNPLIADADDDGTSDIISTSYLSGQVNAWSSMGNILSGFPKKLSSRSYGVPVICDFNDSSSGLIASSDEGFVNLWMIPHSSSRQWPMIRHDSSNTGCYDCGQSQCTPNCAGKTCGSDGCGGSCQPGCASGKMCNSTGQCVSCTPEKEYSSPIRPCCAGLTGFNTPNNLVLCYNSSKGVPVCKAIGTRSEGWYYSKSNELIKYEKCGTCTPQCAGKQCGSDGCGGSCQPGCASGKTCNSTGQCVTSLTCKQMGDVNDDCAINALDYQLVMSNFGKTTSVGDTNGDGVVNAFDLQVVNSNFGKTCESCSGGGGGGGCGVKYVCVGDNVYTNSSCSGMIFNRTCSSGCLDGVCVVGCTPQCTGKQCGSNGCGGICGTCPSGQTCDVGGQCVTGATCTDSDANAQYTDGNNPFVKGTTKGYNLREVYGSVTDVCVDSTKVMEAFCQADGKQYAVTNTLCANGCADGACKMSSGTTGNFILGRVIANIQRWFR